MKFVIVEGAHLRSHFLIQLLNLHVHTLETLHFSTKYDVGNFSYKQQLSEKPLLDMAYAHDRLTKHFGKDGKEAKISHEFAREKALNFLAVMENTKDNIRTQSNTKNAEVVRKNREILSSVIKCVILCGRQNLPLRGHRDDSQHIGDKNTNTKTSGTDFRHRSSL